MALRPRSESEEVTTLRRVTVSIRPRPAEKLRFDEWEKELMDFRRALDAGEKTDEEWLVWLEEHAEAFGFRHGRDWK